MINQPQKPATARETISNYLVEQILGPTEFSLYAGDPLPAPDSEGKVHIEKKSGPRAYHDPETGYPLVQYSRPKMVFGTGILHAPQEDEKTKPNESESDTQTDAPRDAFVNAPVPETTGNLPTSDADESSIDESQKYRPSAMGFTAQFTTFDDFAFEFEIAGATYEEVNVVIDRKRTAKWYRRKAHAEKVIVHWSEISNRRNALVPKPIPGAIGEIANLQLRWRETVGQDKMVQLSRPSLQ